MEGFFSPDGKRGANVAVRGCCTTQTRWAFATPCDGEPFQSRPKKKVVVHLVHTVGTLLVGTFDGAADGGVRQASVSIVKSRKSSSINQQGFVTAAVSFSQAVAFFPRSVITIFISSSFFFFFCQRGVLCVTCR